MTTGRSRMEATKQALYSIGSIYEAIREGHFSPYYGKKIASRYWEKLDLSESEILRYFGGVAGSEEYERDSSITELDWLLRGRKAVKYHSCRLWQVAIGVWHASIVIDLLLSKTCLTRGGKIHDKVIFLIFYKMIILTWIFIGTDRLL